MKEYQIRVDDWIKKYGVRYFNELTNLAILMEEMGEFSRIVAREYGEQSFKKSEQEFAVKDKLAEELSDILFVCFCMANQMGIDLEEAFEKNIIKKTGRDHSRHTGNPKLNP